MSIYVTWDDHEVENNFAGTTVDPGLLAAGGRAFREYMPVGGDGRPEVLYRSFRWGSEVELIVLDARTFRDEAVDVECTAEGEDSPDLLPGLGGQDVLRRYRDFRETVIGIMREKRRIPHGSSAVRNDAMPLAITDPHAIPVPSLRTVIQLGWSDHLLVQLGREDPSTVETVLPLEQVDHTRAETSYGERPRHIEQHRVLDLSVVQGIALRAMLGEWRVSAFACTRHA